MHVGRLDVETAQAEIDSRQFTRWQAYAVLEPFGPVQEDYRFGLLLNWVYNAFRGKGEKAVKPETLFPSLEAVFGAEEDYWDTAEGQADLLMQWALINHAEIVV